MSIRIPALGEEPANSPSKGTGKSAQLRGLQKNSYLAETFPKALLYCYTSCIPFVQPDLPYSEHLEGYHPASDEEFG